MEKHFFLDCPLVSQLCCADCTTDLGELSKQQLSQIVGRSAGSWPEQALAELERRATSLHPPPIGKRGRASLLAAG